MPIIPALWEAKACESPEVRSPRQPDQQSETLNLLKIKKKISRAWWQVPVIPTTLEAEKGELLEPRRWRLS